MIDYHRPAKGYDLASIFCLEEERTISSDWVVRFANQFYQLQPPRKALAGMGRVRVQRYLKGELHFRYGEHHPWHRFQFGKGAPWLQQRHHSQRTFLNS